MLLVLLIACPFTAPYSTIDRADIAAADSLGDDSPVASAVDVMVPELAVVLPGLSRISRGEVGEPSPSCVIGTRALRVPLRV